MCAESAPKFNYVTLCEDILPFLSLFEKVPDFCLNSPNHENNPEARLMRGDKSLPQTL